MPPVVSPVAAAPPAIESVGLEVGAVDLDRSAEFYRRILGFSAVAGPRPPGEAALANGGVRLLLRQALRRSEVEPDQGAHFYLNVEVHDLAATVEELAKLGLALAGPPRDTAIGRFAALKDPAGNVHQVVERKPKGAQPFAPRVFNLGIRLASLAEARKFYGGLGFEVEWENHAPPIIPLKAKGTVPLILFEGTTIPAAAGPEGTARAVLLLATPDLPATLAALARRGLTPAGKEGGDALFDDPSGNRIKLLGTSAP